MISRYVISQGGLTGGSKINKKQKLDLLFPSLTSLICPVCVKRKKKQRLATKRYRQRIKNVRKKK